MMKVQHFIDVTQRLKPCACRGSARRAAAWLAPSGLTWSYARRLHTEGAHAGEPLAAAPLPPPAPSRAWHRRRTRRAIPPSSNAAPVCTSHARKSMRRSGGSASAGQRRAGYGCHAVGRWCGYGAGWRSVCGRAPVVDAGNVEFRSLLTNCTCSRIATRSSPRRLRSVHFHLHADCAVIAGNGNPLCPTVAPVGQTKDRPVIARRIAHGCRFYVRPNGLQRSHRRRRARRAGAAAGVRRVGQGSRAAPGQSSPPSARRSDAARKSSVAGADRDGKPPELRGFSVHPPPAPHRAAASCRADARGMQHRG